MSVSVQTINTSLDDAAAINQLINEYVGNKRSHALEIHSDYAQLWQEIETLIGSGGKRLRSRMVLLAYRIFGGQNSDAILPAAAAMEMLHQAMLIHDDIIDRDYIRYGVPNIAGRYLKNYQTWVVDENDKSHYANNAAILAGDLLLSESYMLLAESQISDQKIIAIMRLMNQSVFEVVGGELLDTESAFRKSAGASSNTIAMYKTASYSFVLPLLVGAELSGATTKDKKYLKDFARNMGIAFQMRDDIIGVFGDSIKTGKTTTGDIREGKRTYLVEKFYELASSTERKQFDLYFGRHDISDDQVEHVRQLLKTSGALDKTEQMIVRCEAKIMASWQEINADPEFDEQIKDLIYIVTKRQA